ncbi:probable fructose-2,6-bisphosphatase TIGAR A [Oppia nitens]|uniref:probable fructose-2,6-bisphosphatase TIGAR A n=1 Tax=Oppia nitens TaxID=1686743 RepID=UPI0023DA00F3|nr:probable fructose-2,6-bisphosphatase TIGAR A [Oppia nitens]
MKHLNQKLVIKEMMCSLGNHFFLTLVRHGQTVANRMKIIQGQTDTKLSDIGIKQAIQLSQHLDCNRFQLIFSSDLSRALDTAKIVVKNDERIQTDTLLRERCFGTIEGNSLDHLKAVAKEHGFPPKPLPEFTPEGGESLEDVSRRVVDFLNNHLLKMVSNESNGSHILIVSHGGVIRQIMKYFKNDLNCDFNGLNPNIITPNTSVNEFKLFYDNNHLISAECLNLHDIKHLIGECKTLALNEEQINDPKTSGQYEAL